MKKRIIFICGLTAVKGGLILSRTVDDNDDAEQPLLEGFESMGADADVGAEAIARQHAEAIARQHAEAIARQLCALRLICKETEVDGEVMDPALDLVKSLESSAPSLRDLLQMDFDFEAKDVKGVELLDTALSFASSVSADERQSAVKWLVRIFRAQVTTILMHTRDKSSGSRLFRLLPWTGMTHELSRLKKLLESTRCLNCCRKPEPPIEAVLAVLYALFFAHSHVDPPIILDVDFNDIDDDKLHDNLLGSIDGIRNFYSSHSYARKDPETTLRRLGPRPTRKKRKVRAPATGQKHRGGLRQHMKRRRRGRNSKQAAKQTS